MWHNQNYLPEKNLITKLHIPKQTMLNDINRLLDILREKTKGEEYSIYQHLIWFRYNNLEQIKDGVFRYGLIVKNPSLSSTTNITGSLQKINADSVLDYHYDTSIDTVRHNLGFIIPNYVVDDKGRKIRLALDSKHPNIPWQEGFFSSILDFIMEKHSNLSNLYSLFLFKLDEQNNEFSYTINKAALPFLPKEQQQQHFATLCQQIKEVLVNKYKILTEQEYDNAKDINPYIDKLIEQEYEKTNGIPYIDPACWEEP